MENTENSRPESLDEALNAAFKLEKAQAAGWDDSAKKLKEELSSKIEGAISTLIKESDTGNLIAALDFFEISSPQCQVIGKDAEHAEDVILSARKIAAKFRFKKAESLFGAAVSPEEEARFEERNKWLEEAMRIVASQIQNKEGDPFGANLLLGKCYYERGRNILPQGEDIPPRKLEAMRKALQYLDESLKIVKQEPEKTDQDTSNEFGDLQKEIHFKRAEVLHELYRLDREGYKAAFKEALETVADKSNGDFKPSDIQQYIILDRYCELCNGGKTDEWNEEILNFLPPKDQIILHRENLELLKAKAALRLYGANNLKEDDLVKAAKSAVEAMEGFALFYPCWDDILEFISHLKKLNGNKTVDKWCELAIHAWEICEEKERQFNFGLQLRQYWSRLKGLYELALKAARKNEDWLVAAKVVDSLKGRTPRMWKQVIGLLSHYSKETADGLNEERKTFFEQEVQAANKFVSGHKKFAKHVDHLLGRRERTSFNIAEIPEGWSAVHLYFRKDKETGCFNDGMALIGSRQPNSKNVTWCRKCVDDYKLNNMWTVYKEWLRKYRNPDADSFDALLALCVSIGDTLPFIFNEADKGQKIIWVPYDFTHKLPLHAAYNASTKKYLFQECASTYIPAWSMISPANKSVSGDSEDYCLRFFQDEHENYLKRIFDEYPWKEKRDSARRDQLLEFVEIFREKSPQNLAIFCHGMAHETNPFDSKLRLGEEGVTLLDLHCMGLNLAGTRVFLGACETEMTPDKPSRLDEHLSLAGAFLTMGCAEVMGSLWRCKESMTHELIRDSLNTNPPLWKIVKCKQKKWMKDGWGNEKERRKHQIWPVQQRLHYIAPFRAIGYPVQSTKHQTSSSRQE